METYFSKFPAITYNNISTRNIAERVSLTEAKTSPSLFYPHEVKEHQRPDIISHVYYQDANMDWLIYLSNGITDPYYDWYLSDEEFENYINIKYGSIEIAQKSIAYYATNWADDLQNISLEAYAAQPEVTSKYYQPVFGYKGKILSYTRRQEDWYANTNKIIKLDLTYTTDTIFTAGEIVDVWYDGAVVGGGEVITSDTTMLMMQHVSGFYEAGYTVIGETSAAEATITVNTTVQAVISDDEYSFWYPVYWYDVEAIKNQENKFIYLLDERFALETSASISRKLQGISIG